MSEKHYVVNQWYEVNGEKCRLNDNKPTRSRWQEPTPLSLDLSIETVEERIARITNQIKEEV